MKIVATFLIIVLLLVSPDLKAGIITDLTQAQWELTGFDLTSWNGSDLIFQTQIPNGSNFTITGYFNWYNSGIYRGTELFSGTYFSNGLLDFDGYQLVNPVNIVLSSYNAEVLTTTQIGNGTWSAPGINGSWSATTIPEPTSTGLVGTSLFAACFFHRRKTI